MINDKNPRNKIVKAYQTFPLANAAKRDKATNESYPSDDDVKEVKDWCFFNKK